MKKALRVLLLYGLSTTVIACHFHDNRIKTINNSTENMYFSIWEGTPTSREDLRSPFYLVKTGQKENITLDQNLQYEHFQSDSLTVLVVSVQAHNSVRKPSGYFAFEDLLGSENTITLTVAIADALESGLVELKSDKRLYLD